MTNKGVYHRYMYGFQPVLVWNKLPPSRWQLKLYWVFLILLERSQTQWLQRNHWVLWCYANRNQSCWYLCNKISYEIEKQTPPEYLCLLDTNLNNLLVLLVSWWITWTQMKMYKVWYICILILADWNKYLGWQLWAWIDSHYRARSTFYWTVNQNRLSNSMLTSYWRWVY